MTPHLIYRQYLADFPDLSDGMLRDRGVQFKERLGWNLRTDAEGRERDQYDDLDPLYLIVSDDGNRHLGSTRLMPTTGPTMIGDCFMHLTDDVAITSPLIWEVTRFFVSDQATRHVAPLLMWAGCSFARQAGIEYFVGVTGAHMVRVFRACGWPSDIIGTSGSAEGEICACLWEVSDEICDTLRRKAGLPADILPPAVYRPTATKRDQRAA
jgi:acyl homoserine lactone synthase